MCEEEREERFDSLFYTTLKVYGKELARSMIRVSPFVYMLKWKTRRKNVADIQAILTAEINNFGKLPKDKKIHIVIKILKVINQW